MITEYVEANRVKKIKLTDSKQISCVFTDCDNVSYRGEIVKIYLDKNNEAVGYDVYVY